MGEQQKHMKMQKRRLISIQPNVISFCEIREFQHSAQIRIRIRIHCVRIRIHLIAHMLRSFFSSLLLLEAFDWLFTFFLLFYQVFTNY